MKRKLLALSLILNVFLIAGVGLVEHRALMHDARAFWHQWMGSPATPAAAVPMATGEILIVVDPGADVHDISPYIYGVAKRDPGAVAGPLTETMGAIAGTPLELRMNNM